MAMPKALPAAVRTKGPGERGRPLSALVGSFSHYCAYQLNFSPATVKNYRHYLGKISRLLGDPAPENIGRMEVFTLKAMLAERGQSENLLNCLRTFLRFCRGHLHLNTLEPEAIRGHRPPRREVLFLTPEEIAAFVAAIPVMSEGGTLDLRWLRFRTLVEVLLGTGMRISECLSLRRSKIDFGAKEAQIIGKGNIERTVFFTARSLGWVKELLNHQVQESDFVFWRDRAGRILTRDAAAQYFQVIRGRAGMQKKVTAHMLRHTVATTLLFNGCPIGHIRDILGHAQLQTTCEYYLGTDKRAARQAHQSYLRFD